MEFTVVMDALAFSKEVFENILPILVFVSMNYIQSGPSKVSQFSTPLVAVFIGPSLAS